MRGCTGYEMFYARATFVTKAHSYRTCEGTRATDLVDRVLAGSGLTVEARSALTSVT